MNQKKLKLRVCILFFAGLSTVLSTSMILLADDGDAPAWTAPSRASRKKNPIAADDKSLAAGKAIYITQCLKCHGETGKGDGPSARDLKPAPKDLSDKTVASQTDGALFWKITTGRKPMPGFETLISDDDRWNVVNFMRTLEPTAKDQPAK